MTIHSMHGKITYNNLKRLTSHCNQTCSPSQVLKNWERKQYTGCSVWQYIKDETHTYTLTHSHMWGEIMGRQTQTKPVGSSFRRDKPGQKHWLAHWAERKHSGGQPRGRTAQSLSANRETNRHQQQLEACCLCLAIGSKAEPSKPEHTPEQAEKRKEKRKPLTVNRSHEDYGTGSLLQWQTCVWRTGMARGFLQHFSQPSFIHMECLSSSSCLCDSHGLSDGEEEDGERVLCGSFCSYQGQEATHADLYSQKGANPLDSQSEHYLLKIYVSRLSSLVPLWLHLVCYFYWPNSDHSN